MRIGTVVALLETSLMRLMAVRSAIRDSGPPWICVHEPCCSPIDGGWLEYNGRERLWRWLLWPGRSSRAYGVLNYTMFQLSKRDYFTVRNEWWRDERGERSGYTTSYSSHTIKISHQFNDLVMIRPEIGFYHSYDVPAFNLGTTKNLLMYGFDFTVRF